jgi:hypothetical protein
MEAFGGVGGGRNTVATCIAACKGRWRFAGLEYGRECWCGNTLGAIGSVPVAVDQCNMPCADNATETCGAGLRLNIYQPDEPPKPVIKAVVLSGAGDEAASWGFAGCFTEATVGRALAGPQYASDYMTLETCASFCAGYGVFGIEYRRECKWHLARMFMCSWERCSGAPRTVDPRRPGAKKC